MKNLTIFTFFVIITFSSLAQGLVDISNTGTCEQALDISRFKQFGPTTAPAPIEPGNAINFQYPKHPTWYSLKIPHDGILLFDIIPEQPTDNYDFLLFKATGNFCELYKSGRAKPIKSNLNPPSQNDKGHTGLSMETSSSAYEKSIDVKKGEVFYLALNNAYENGKGHTVILNFPEIRKIKGTITNQNGTPINASLEWTNLRDTKMTAFENTEKKGEYKMNIPLSSENNSFPQYQLIVYEDKYIPKIINYSTPEARKLGTKDVDIKLDKIKKGLNNEQFGVIYFLPNEDKITQESGIILKKLIYLMNKNPKVAVTLEGHTNGLYPSTDIDMQLSGKRAIVVKELLEEKGIDENRIQIKGYGSTKKIYPIPEDEEQEGANRRVEIFFDRF